MVFLEPRYQTRLPRRGEILDPKDREPTFINRVVRMGAAVAGAGLALRYAAKSGVLSDLGEEASAFLRAVRSVTQEGVRDPATFMSVYREGARHTRPDFEIDRLVRERQVLLDRVLSTRDVNIPMSAVSGSIDEAIIERLQSRTQWSRLLGMAHTSVSDIGREALAPETQRWLESIPEIAGELRVDTALFKSKDSSLFDFGGWKDVGDRSARWWSRTLFGSILHIRDYAESKDAPIGAILPRGTKHPTISEGLIQSDMLVAGGRVMNLETGEIVKEGVSLIPGRFSRQSQMLYSMAGEGYPDEPLTFAGRAAQRLRLDKFLDVGYQRGDTKFRRFSAWFEERLDPQSRRLMMERAMVLGEEVDDETRRQIGNLLRYKTEPLSRDTLRSLEEHLPEAFHDLSFLSPAEAMESLRQVAEREGSSRLIQSFWEATRSDQDRFFRSDWVSSVRTPFTQHLDVLTPEKQIQRMVSIEAVSQAAANVGGIHPLLSSLEEASTPGLFSKTDFGLVKRLYASAAWDEGVLRTHPSRWTASALAMLQGDSEDALFFRETLRDAISKDFPWYKVNEYTQPAHRVAHNALTSDFTVISQSETLNKFASLRNMNDFLSAMSSAGRELSAGRERMEDVTRLTLAPYFSLYRLSTGLEQAGLGLSDLSTSSTADLAKGIFFKRAVAGYAAVQTASYLNYISGAVTGRSIKQRAWDVAAGARLDIAGWQDSMNLTDWRKRRHDITRDLWEPLSELPAVGWVFDEPKSRDELAEYYREGRQPIRTGRYWGASGTPFRGGSISYWLPNEYIMGTEDWKLTDTVYGSGQEYWSRQWFPTPTFPFAPIKFLLNPYWLEEKHKEDRPYPLTGSLISPEIPGASLVNLSIGRLIKPQKAMHVSEIRKINEEIASQAQMRTPAIGLDRRGRILPIQYQPVPGSPHFAAWLPGDEEASPGWAMPGGIGVVRGGMGDVPLPISEGVFHGGFRAAGRYVDEPGQGVFAFRQEVRDDYIDGPETELEDSPLLHPDHPSYHAKQIEYSTKKLLGIYGWAAEVATGKDPLQGRRVIQSANRMTGAQRTFYDSEMGGLGGALSRFGRRIVPRPQKTDEWNPIPNTMPDWLPGANYFINFKTGDPFSKVPHGEVRLPGEAYETTHTLYSDPWFGEYGALTRFSILADVAPYSDEYRAYKETVRDMFREGMLPEEWRSVYDRTLEETRKQTGRYDFAEYRFSDVYNRTEMRTVTVSRILDSSTFLASEFPENPIRLAGVRLSQDQSISSFIKPGMRVEVQYNKEDSAMYSKDMLNTIRATVFVRGVNLNYELLQSNVGRETTETHPAAIIARYTPAEIARGATTESAAHLNIPIIHKKFMPVNSALEHYERYEVYGKSWQSWKKPVSSILTPTYRSYAAKNPLSAAFLGGITGGVIGQIFLGGGTRTTGTAVVSAAISATLSMMRITGEALSGEKYIPAEREKQREIHEYFDALEYIKFRSLYEEAARKTRFKEGLNIDRVLDQVKDRQANRSREVHRLNALKKAMIISGEPQGSEKLQEINEQIRSIQQSDRLDGISLGPWAQLALVYRSRYESTMFGLDLTQPDYQMIYRALPASDREFFTEFSKETSSTKRKKILDLVPDNQKRIYRKVWGLDRESTSLRDMAETTILGGDPSVSRRRRAHESERLAELTSYFSEHALPTADWVGWRPEIELDWVKAKVAAEEGVELPEIGLWLDDLDNARMLGVQPIDMNAEGPVGVELRQRIYSLLRGKGFLDVQILVNPTTKTGINVDLDVSEDPRNRISYAIRSGQWM